MVEMRVGVQFSKDNQDILLDPLIRYFSTGVII